MPLQPLSRKILAWFSKHGRDLPWRRTYAPYHIWISEIMLQQTQMDRAVKYFQRWLERFPDIETLAAAHEDEVLKLWEGLGYYSRARNILKTARILATEHQAIPPEDHASLLALPGIGKYTAGAIMSIAFNREYTVMDANVERLFARLFDIASPVKGKAARQMIRRQAQSLLPTGKARQFNQGLMELGALICLPKSPRCASCPIQPDCKAFDNGTVDRRPVLPKRQQTIHIKMATGVLIANGKIFIQKRPAAGVWANLWEFPGGRIEPGETPEKALVREFREETEFMVAALEKIKVVRHNYTKYRVTQHCFFCRLSDGPRRPVLHAAQECRWVRPAELHTLAFPTGHRRLINTMFDQIRATAEKTRNNGPVPF